MQNFEFEKQDKGWVAQVRNTNNKQLSKFRDISNELCVVGGEIYNSKIYVGQSENIVAALLEMLGFDHDVVFSS